TGRSPFARDTFSETVAAILDRDPDWAALPAETPRAVRRLLRRCLAKDPQHRLRDIGDARLEIDESIASPQANLHTATRGTRTSPVWIVAVVVLAASVLALLALRRVPPADTAGTTSPVHFAVTAPRGGELDVAPSPSVSRDGRSVAFGASRAGTQQIYVRDL